MELYRSFPDGAAHAGCGPQRYLQVRCGLLVFAIRRVLRLSFLFCDFWEQDVHVRFPSGRGDA